MSTKQGKDRPHSSQPVASRQNISRADMTPLAELMTRDVICAQEDEEVSALSQRFLELGISGAPVLDRNGRPVGIISKTDLVRYSFEHGARSPKRHPLHHAESNLLIGKSNEMSGRARVRDIMTPLAYTLSPEVSIARAAALMAFEGIHRLPIITAPGGELVGILSAVDILRWLGERDGYLRQSAAEGEMAVA